MMERNIETNRNIEKVSFRDLNLKSIITCPECNYQQEENIPIIYGKYIYKCKNCGKILLPKEGDCCVFCSYGSIPCAAKQKEKNI